MPNDWNLAVAGMYGQAGGPVGPTGPTGPQGASGAIYQCTSTTNLPIALGPITVTTQAGLAWQVGARARLSSNSAPSQWMEGLITAYTGTSLSVSVDLTNATAATTQAPSVLPNYLGGLTLANDTTTPATFIDIGSGGATSDDNSTLMTLPVTNFRKNCNAAWVVGSGLGALDSGSALAASTWYHVYIIERTDTAVVDALISTSATAPVMPTNYTKKRRIGSFKTDATPAIVPFKQFGDEFLWTTTPNNTWDVNNAATAVAPGTLFTLNVPLGINVVVIVNVAWGVTGLYGRIASPDETATSNPWNMGSPQAAAIGGQYRIRTNTNQQVRALVAAASSSGFYMGAVGWVDPRGR